MASQPAPLLDVQHLTTVFETAAGRLLPAVDDVSFSIGRGETLGLVGESGSGKSVTAWSILRLVRPPGRIARGRVLFEGADLLQLPEAAMQRVRGARIGLVVQEPMAALSPVFTVGDQVAEAMVVHGTPRRAARDRAVELLAAVRVPDAARRAHDYPHQLSGGLQQRALLAMALACRPALLIADEPTTALDATVQAQILDLLAELRERFRLSLLLVTHDLGVLASLADQVAVMYAGRLVEQGPVREVFRDPAHPYTRALLGAMRVTGRGRLQALDGAVPALHDLPPGCAFGPRCADRRPVCDQQVPPMTSLGGARETRCHFHLENSGRMGQQPPVR
jgi:oligopeptide/dipeptide ABC transporter ATP-binding protein